MLRNKSKTLILPEGLLFALSAMGLRMGSNQLTYGELRHILTYLHDGKEALAFNRLSCKTAWPFDRVNTFLDLCRVELIAMNQSNAYNIVTLTASIEAQKEITLTRLAMQEQERLATIERELFLEFKAKNCMVFMRRITMLSDLAKARADHTPFLAYSFGQEGMSFTTNSDLDFSSESDLIMEDYKALDIERARQ